MKKLSILMPTYNDSDTIEESLNSILNQSYENWELIIIDDGSTDNTKNVIENYKKKHNLEDKIIYIFQENMDQLRALLNGAKYISGDYVYVLHSDDLLFDNSVVDKAIRYLEKNPKIDGVIGDLTIIDENSNITGIQKILKYENKDKVIATQLLWLGRNLYVDLVFCRKEIFLNEVFQNYLTWNRPFWLKFDEEKVSMLNISNVEFSLMKYRIHSGNYANNEIGKLCLINGELRTATELMKFYNIPFYRLQYIIFRIFNKLKLVNIYSPIYYRKETNNKEKIVKYIINKRYKTEYKKYQFLVSLIKFYENKQSRIINFEQIYNGKDPIYLGNDLRIFNKQMVNNNLPKLYYDMFKEMDKGFDTVLVSEENKKNVENLLKFLCIYPYVSIRSSKDEEKDS